VAIVVFAARLRVAFSSNKAAIPEWQVQKKAPLGICENINDIPPPLDGLPNHIRTASSLSGRNARGFAHDAANAFRALDLSVSDKGKLPIEHLRSSPLFAGLCQAAEWALVEHARQRSFSNRKIIFRQDDPVRFVDVIGSGSVKITQVSQNGNEVILYVERAGSPIDGIGNSSERTHTTTAYTVGDCSILSWDVCRFRDLVERFPIISRNASAIVMRRLRLLEESFCDVTTALVPQRLARVLLRLAGPERPHQGDSVGLSREELAQMIGTSIFTVSRLLCEWAERDIVHVTRKCVIIENLGSLLQLSQDATLSEDQLDSEVASFAAG
jgi:CRP/FNR family transcriptional regulator, nitrogen oxide reductase regulator